MMIPLEDDWDEPSAGGLELWIQTNVANAGGVTVAVIDDAIEAGWPEVYSRQFEAEIVPPPYLPI